MTRFAPPQLDAHVGRGPISPSSSAEVVPVPRARRQLAARAPRDGERLALRATALAVALLPLLKPGGPANLAPVDPFLALAVGAVALWLGISRRRLRFPYAAAVVLSALGGAIGALAGPVPDAGLIALAQDFWLAIWCWAVVVMASSAANLRVLLAAWAYSALAWGGLLLVGLVLGIHAITGQNDWDASRTSLTLGDPSYAASYFFISMMLMWATERPRSPIIRRIGYAVLVAGILSTGSNSGMVSLFVGTSAATVVGVYRRNGAMATVAVSAGLLLLAAGAIPRVHLSKIQDKAHSSQFAFVRDGIGRSSVSVSQRGEILRESMALRRDGPPVGAGPVSTKPRLYAERAQFVKEAHDDYLAAVMERGPVGVLGLLVLVAGLVARVLAVNRDGLKPAYAAILVKPNALVGAVAGSCVAMTVYELLHVRHVWALFGLIAAVHIWGRRR